ncbi:MAG TPA: hypothetical protein VJ782_04215 [Aeromicrobium sp.]|nr:hypothetical protein [Aeromicrobium sp.]
MRDPQMLELLLGSQSVEIDGDICVDVVEPTEFLRWARVLLNPAVFAWRSTVTGERRLQICGNSAHYPVHGRVTVVLDGDRHRDLWDAMQQDDLRCGEEERIDLLRLRQAALKRRRREQATRAA